MTRIRGEQEEVGSPRNDATQSRVQLRLALKFVLLFFLLLTV